MEACMIWPSSSSKRWVQLSHCCRLCLSIQTHWVPLGSNWTARRKKEEMKKFKEVTKFPLYIHDDFALRTCDSQNSKYSLILKQIGFICIVSDLFCLFGISALPEGFPLTSFLLVIQMWHKYLKWVRWRVVQQREPVLADWAVHCLEFSWKYVRIGMIKGRCAFSGWVFFLVGFLWFCDWFL